MADPAPFDGFPQEGLDFVAQPKAKGSIAPTNNDLRFSPGKNPYDETTGAELATALEDHGRRP